jgi:hypothetical protein
VVDVALPAVPKDPSLLVRTSPVDGMRVVRASLGTLLEYDDNDTGDDSFELALFAEGLHELFMAQYGARIADALIAARCDPGEGGAEACVRATTWPFLRLPKGLSSSLWEHVVVQ